MTDADDGLPHLTIRDLDDDLLDTLRELQFVLLRHPVAAQAAFSALVVEGRSFAATHVGQQWVERLAGSELMRQGRTVWEVVSLKLLEENPTTVLPTAYLDALVQATASQELEPLLARLFRPAQPNTRDEGDLP